MIGVSRGTVASKAGVSVGDVIVEFAGESVTKRREVSRSIRKLKGEDVIVKLLRDGKEVVIDVKLESPE